MPRQELVLPKEASCHDIEAKGVTRNYSTKPNEKCHGPLKEAYQQRTNFKDVAPQVCLSFLLFLILIWVACRYYEQIIGL